MQPGLWSGGLLFSLLILALLVMNFIAPLLMPGVISAGAKGPAVSSHVWATLNLLITPKILSRATPRAPRRGRLVLLQVISR